MGVQMNIALESPEIALGRAGGVLGIVYPLKILNEFQSNRKRWHAACAAIDMPILNKTQKINNRCSNDYSLAEQCSKEQ